MPVERSLPTPEAEALLELTKDLAVAELAPRAADYEAGGRFPREVLRTLGECGLLGLPYPVEYGGGGQPYEIYLQVLEELSTAWLTVGLSVGVHGLACLPLAEHGSRGQRERFLPGMLEGGLLGGYCLSEPQSGSDAAALRTRAVRTEGGYQVDGTKAWTTHGGVADFYTLFARTGGSGAHGISCFHVPSGTSGVQAAPPEHKMGLWASTTAQMVFTEAPIPADHRIGPEGEGFPVALAALDAGRLGIAACSVGLAQAACDTAVGYAKQRHQFGEPIIDFQGVMFLLADMATGIEAARALYLEAARRKDQGRSYSHQAAMAKLFASDVAMRVTTDAVQVLGGYGYVSDYPAERYFREAKALQIVEGTNQIQRLVIGRQLGAAQHGST